MRYGSRKVGVSHGGRAGSPQVGFFSGRRVVDDIGNFYEKVAKLNCARIDHARKLDLLRRKVMKARGNADRLRL